MLILCPLPALFQPGRPACVGVQAALFRCEFVADHEAGRALGARSHVIGHCIAYFRVSGKLNNSANGGSVPSVTAKAGHFSFRHTCEKEIAALRSPGMLR